VRGTISSSWWKYDNQFHLEVTIPANTSATIYLPVFENSIPDIYEGNILLVDKGTKTDNDQGIRVERLNNQSVVISVGSGNYHFKVNSVK
jgi:alpha-L-rhamnosidase